MLTRNVCFYLIILILPGCKNDEIPVAKSPELPSGKGVWITFQSPDAPYTVRLPSQPVKRSQMTADGMLNKYICALGNNLALMTCANKFGGIDLSKPELYNTIFDAATKAAIGESQGTVTEQKTFLLQDKFPVRSFTATYNTPQAGAGTMRLRIILTENELIELMIAGTDAEMQKPENSLFLESIKIQE